MRNLNVVVATPLGEGGNGGIDRMMDFVRHEAAQSGEAHVNISFWVTRGNGSIMLAPLFLMAFLIRFLVVRIAGQIDLLHVNLASYGSTYRKLVICAFAQRLGVPYMLHLHGADYPAFWQEASAALRRRIVNMYVGAAGVIVLGEVWREFVFDIAPHARTVILRNATPTFDDVHADAHADRLPLILFLGRLGARKGTPELIDAAARIAALPDWQMVVAGDGPVDETRADVAHRGLTGRVAVPGWVGPGETAALLSRATVMVLPSHAENLPMSVIEGLAAGLAVVTTPVGAVPEIIEHEVNGLLVPPGDPAALAEALERVIVDRELRERLATAGQTFHAEELSIASYWRKLNAIWRDAAAGLLVSASEKLSTSPEDDPSKEKR
jgi:glycosyltransferase involved in cell wall biosynthesis